MMFTPDLASVDPNLSAMLLILLLVYVFHSLGLASPLPVHNVATTFQHFRRDLPICECPSGQRTVWGILWSCLATTFTCTWVSVHPNIPGPDNSAWKVAKRRAGLMIWAILAPELVIYWAIRQWIGARQFAETYHEFNWTKTHGYFLQMGGFMLYESDRKMWKYVLDGSDLKRLFKRGEIMFPTITEEEILDRSKGNGLTKAIAIFQTTWFVAQCIARHIQGLVVTELEIITLAFATLNGLMFSFWWNKPLAVRYSVPVFLLQKPRAKQIIVEKGNQSSFFWDDIPKLAHQIYDVLWWSSARAFDALKEFQWSRKAVLKILWKLLESSLKDPISNFCGDGSVEEGSYIRAGTRHAEITNNHAYSYQLAILVVAIGNLFGAIHCAAWSSPFPSDAERILWRVCSLILLSMPEILLLAIAVGVFDILNKFFWFLVFPLVWFVNSATFVGAPLYTMARLTLIIKAFLTLRALTPAALAEVEWTSVIPHI